MVTHDVLEGHTDKKKIVPVPKVTIVYCILKLTLSNFPHRYLKAVIGHCFHFIELQSGPHLAPDRREIYMRIAMESTEKFFRAFSLHLVLKK
jgi:hypothetical protein